MIVSLWVSFLIRFVFVGLFFRNRFLYSLFTVLGIIDAFITAGWKFGLLAMFLGLVVAPIIGGFLSIAYFFLMSGIEAITTKICGPKRGTR